MTSEQPIRISWLNDFTFCPASIYYHGMYEDLDAMAYQSEKQVRGTAAHRAVDEARYTTSRHVLQGTTVYSGELGLIGKIDLFDSRTGLLTERKRHVAKVHDGYVFQLYAQCYALTEMGYEVRRLRIHSLDDNKSYQVSLPDEDEKMRESFFKVVADVKSFDVDAYRPDNPGKCSNCIYNPLCEKSCATTAL